MYFIQQTRHVCPIPDQCWPTVHDAEPTLIKRWVNVSWDMHSVLYRAEDVDFATSITFGNCLKTYFDPDNYDHIKELLKNLPLVAWKLPNAAFWVSFYVCLSSSCVALHCIALLCIALHCIALHCIVLYCIVLYCIVLYRIVLYCIVLYCIVLYCIVLYCIVLYCIVLYCIVLYFIVLYCIVVLLF